MFAIIERWTKVDSGDVHWRSIYKDNITTLYGKTAANRLAYPIDPTHVFSWLICESYDDRGNAIRYEYKAENLHEIVTAQAHERNRNLESRSTNRYRKRIKYENRTPRQPNQDLSLRKDWLFEVVLDDGEHNPTNPKPNDRGAWTVCTDPFSSYRSGFEVRTYRLCQRVLMFHHFPDEVEVGQDCLVGLLGAIDRFHLFLRTKSHRCSQSYLLIITVSKADRLQTKFGRLRHALPLLS